MSLIIGSMNVGFDWWDSESVLCPENEREMKEFGLGMEADRDGQMGVIMLHAYVLCVELLPHTQLQLPTSMCNQYTHTNGQYNAMSHESSLRIFV